MSEWKHRGVSRVCECVCGLTRSSLRQKVTSDPCMTSNFRNSVGSSSMWVNVALVWSELEHSADVQTPH